MCRACAALKSDSLESGGGLCNSRSTTFDSSVRVGDAKTGLRSVRVASPGSRLFWLQPLVVGSVRNKTVLIKTDCCYNGVELRLKDVAGNEAKCVIGVNPNHCPASNAGNAAGLLLTFALCLLSR